MSNRTSFEDRPWQEGGIYALVEEGVDPDLIQIVCYLEEDCPVAETRVVYRVLSMDMCFDQTLEDAAKYIREIKTGRTFIID